MSIDLERPDDLRDGLHHGHVAADEGGGRGPSRDPQEQSATVVEMGGEDGEVGHQVRDRNVTHNATVGLAFTYTYPSRARSIIRQPIDIGVLRTIAMGPVHSEARGRRFESCQARPSDGRSPRPHSRTSGADMSHVDPRLAPPSR